MLQSHTWQLISVYFSADSYVNGEVLSYQLEIGKTVFQILNWYLTTLFPFNFHDYSPLNEIVFSLAPVQEATGEQPLVADHQIDCPSLQLQKRPLPGRSATQSCNCHVKI